MYVTVFCIQPLANATFLNTYGQPETLPPENQTFSLAWRRNGLEFVDVVMEGEANGWIALGITMDRLDLDNVRNSCTIVFISTKYVPDLHSAHT